MERREEIYQIFYTDSPSCLIKATSRSIFQNVESYFPSRAASLSDSTLRVLFSADMVSDVLLVK
ncbi:hypothetical protein Lal_00037560 [Lupinus albus]|nr:hypothetical protein Lal_00037560 [Lupinus albus]